MYVPSPARPNNGTTILYQVVHRGDGGGIKYTTSGDAIAGPYGDAPIINTAVKSYTVRGGMTRGIVNGKFKPTNYQSRRAVVETKRGLKWVVRIPASGGNPAYYSNRYREIGVGYKGGSQTGIGWPESQFARNGTPLIASTVVNNAIGLNLENRIQSEALLKCRDQKFDLSETLVGLGQSVDMVLDRSIQLLLAYRQARRGQWVDAIRTLGIWNSKKKWKLPTTKDAANFWLELQYGWMPLMNDIHSGMKIVNEGLGKPTSTLVATRRGHAELPAVQWTGGNEPYDWSKKSVKALGMASVEVKYRFRVNDPTLALLSTLGVDNPLYVVWVAVPWTFVIDWAVPIGDWVRTISSPLGLTFVDGYMSSRRTAVIDVYGSEFGNFSDPTYPTVWHSDPAWTQMRYVELNRTAFTSWPKPSPYVRFPFTSQQRLTNLLALIAANRRA